MKKIIILLFLQSTILYSFNTAFAWGERGHHTVTYLAAKLLTNQTQKQSKEETYFNEMFSNHALMLGFLSNVPDISWKDKNNLKLVNKVGFSNHFIDPEIILGTPDKKNPKLFLDKIRNLPADYSVLLKKYQNTNAKLKNTPKSRKKVHIYDHVGTAPWRIQEFYNLLVEAFKCVKVKLPVKEKIKYPLIKTAIPFHKTFKSTPTYQCNKKTDVYADTYAVMQLAGLMSHFVADLAQPYHTTVDYDGWSTGNGGLHAYFETDIVNALDETLKVKAFNLASKTSFKANLWKSIRADLNKPNGVARFALHLVANSFARKDYIEKLDNKYAVLKKGTRLKMGDAPYLHAKDKIKKAKRRNAKSKKILKEFENIVVERIAVGSLVMAKIWRQAWVQAGKPVLKNLTHLNFPYAQDVPFIWPQYDLDAVLKIQKKLNL